MDFLLGLGIGTDTETDDRLDLTGGPYYALADQFRVDEDATDPRYVLVVFGMHIKGTTKAALLDARNAIVDKLNQATLGGTAVQDWVTLDTCCSGCRCSTDSSIPPCTTETPQRVVVSVRPGMGWSVWRIRRSGVSEG